MLGHRLNTTRKQKGITALQMAEKLNVGLHSYRKYESGHRQPSLAALVKIADILDVSLDYLLGRDEFIEKQKDSMRKSDEVDL